MTLPALGAMGASGRSLRVLARPHLLPLLRLFPGVAGILERSADDAETIARIRAADVAEAVVLPNSFRSAWLPFRAEVPRRWGYRGSLRAPLLSPAVAAPARDRHQAEDYVELLSAMGVAPPATWVPWLPLPGETLARGRDVCRRAGLAAGRGRLVGLFPGAEYGPSKRWPWRRFAGLARELRNRDPEVRCLTVAGPKETWLGVRIHEQSAGTVPVVGPDLDLAELAGVLAGLDLLITNDSGPMHLAAAVGTPCLAIFGPTEAGRTRPCGTHHRVLDRHRWCAPCFRRRCPLLHHRCMREIGVGEVAEAATEMLAPPADAHSISKSASPPSTA